MQDNFRFWLGTLTALEAYSDEEAGAMVKDIAHEVFYGERTERARGYKKGDLAFYEKTVSEAIESATISRRNAENGRKGGRPPKEKGPKTPPLTKGKEGKGNESSFPFGKEGSAAAPSGATPPVPPPPAP